MANTARIQELVKIYTSEFSKSKIKVVSNFEDVITSARKADINFLIGAEIGANSATAMFSNTGFYSGPVSLSLLINAYLKYKFQSVGKYEVTSSSFPIQPRKSVCDSTIVFVTNIC